MGAVTSRIWATGSSDLKLDSVIKLSNGVTMPRLGFGVWQVDPAVCTSVVETALEAGYRHVDSAKAYRNEAEAGAALRLSSVVKRKDVFFTTKVFQDLGSVDANYASLIESVNKINGDGPDADAYVDLFLIHTPRMGAEGIKNLWLALEKLLKEGKTRSIGVSNFNGDQIQGIKEYATVWPPHVNQIQVSTTSIQCGDPRVTLTNTDKCSLTHGCKRKRLSSTVRTMESCYRHTVLLQLARSSTIPRLARLQRSTRSHLHRS